MINLTYQQMRLMERIANAKREQIDYLLAPIEAGDATACAAAGLLNAAGDGSVELTEAGNIYIMNLNKGIDMANVPTQQDAELAILDVFQHFGTRPGESIKMIAINDLMVGENSFRADELNAAVRSMADKEWISANRPGFFTLTDKGFKQLNPRREQKVQDFANLETPIQDFLGWALALDQAKFVAVLQHAGHHSTVYQAEKWAEFERNKIGFLWHWTSQFVAAWSARI